jgi:hypothetical protein
VKLLKGTRHLSTLNRHLILQTSSPCVKISPQQTRRSCHERSHYYHRAVVATTAGVLKVSEQPKELIMDRLIVHKELIVSDTGQPWEAGYEAQQIPRGIYAKSVGEGSGGSGSAAG